MGTFTTRYVYEKTINLTGSGATTTVYSNPTIGVVPTTDDDSGPGGYSIRIGTTVAGASLTQVRLNIKVRPELQRRYSVPNRSCCYRKGCHASRYDGNPDRSDLQRWKRI
jgi:hypothetical protein